MQSSRRSFLAALTAAPGLEWLATRPLAAAGVEAVHSSFDPWIEVDAARLRHNAEQVARRVAPRPILAVIKNNGYGLGLLNVARLLEPLAPIAGFAVVKLQEAVALRDGGILKPVLLMGPVAEHELELALARGITPMVYTPIGPLLERLARRRGQAVGIQICVDTGIGRVGVPHRQAAGLIRDLAARPGVRVEGTMMTFSEDAAYDEEQLARFEALCATLAGEGLELGRKHAASSYALFQHPGAFLDMVRPGMVLYGIYPEQGFRASGVLDLQPAVALKARVAYVKRLAPGDSAGYERAYVAQREVWLATIPAGHADGLPRAAAKGAQVRIGGDLYPLIATVSASHSIAEIGREPKVQVGEVATFFDAQPGSRPEDFGKDCATSVYDLTMHLNPLLPRRVV